MKKLAIILIAMFLLASTADAKTKIWESKDSVSESVCYEYDNKRDVHADFGRKGWSKDSTLWLKDTDRASVVVTKTDDKKWSVAVIIKR